MDKRKRADHYHVVTGLPGYLPNENWPCETLKEARDMALHEAASFREGGYHASFGKDGLGRVVGNKRDGYEVLRSLWHDGADGLGTGTVWHTWQSIRIEPCNEVDCRCAGCGALLHEDYGCTECTFEHEEHD